MDNQHVLKTNQHAINNDIPDYEKFMSFLLGQCGYCPENHGTVYLMESLHAQYIPYEKAPQI